MKDISIGQGETIRESITVEDDGAVTAEFIATDGNVNVIAESFNFVNKVATILILDTVKPIGEYQYYYKITWDDTSVDYIPDFRNCDGDCELPTLTICDIPGVS